MAGPSWWWRPFPVGARLANGRSRLERRDSTTSMTERTFRSPSPHRSSTPAATEQRPPVPQIPDSHKSSTANSKAIGVGMQNFRTASQKMADEPPSWHVQPTGDVSNVRTSDSIMRTTKSPPDLANPITPQTSRPESRSSVNFSYPTSFRPQSPPASPTSLSMSHTKVSSPHPPTSVTNAGRGTSSNSHAQSNQQLVYDPNSRRMVPKSQVNEPMEHPTQKVADKPSKSRKDCGLRREGSQLAKGTVARAKGTMVGENRSLRELPKRDQPVIEAMPTTKEMLLETEFEPESVVATENANLITSPQLSVVGESKSQDSSPSKPETLSKQESDSQPSHFAFNHTAVAQGESKANVEVPKMENRPKPSQTILDALDAIPMRQTLFEGRHPHPGYNLDPHGTAQDPRPRNMAPKRTELLEASSEQKAAVAENKPVTVLASESSALRRSNSNSPARQARFAPSPSENLAVRHVPLPRSASPIKSAMKHSSPIQRETSPSDNISDPSGSGAVSPDQKEEPAVLRKKSVRVSFDDQSTVIVGDPTPAMEADSIASQSPQGHRRTWFSNIGRSKKKEVTLDDDEIMKPRPALPSFGSIRDKKKRGLEERPLVRPLEPAESPAISTSPELRPQSSSTLNDSDVIEEPTLGQSSDHVIGALLVQDQTSRNAANISRFREPLPPVVTSVEEYGYSSDSFQGSDSEEQCDTTTEAGISTMNSSVLSAQVAPPDPHDQNQGPAAASDIPQSKQEQTPYPEATQQQEIPQISVIQPSPMPSESATWANESSTAHYFDVPGSFPGGDSHLSCEDWAKATKNGVVESDLPSSTSVPEPNTALAESAQVEVLPRTTSDTTTSVTKLNQAITDDATKDESDESIYSDAYEDIPDFDTSGFMSLDAIVEGPTVEEPKPSSSQISEGLPTPAITSNTRRIAP
ncbi:hypothetical protein NUW58_g244 [Xylaria curta]|uniref:Uncharacterized protein n=1 Tax=Xylaria curta TaxID=42375 RepID=A0ACC1PSX3_9PEZI|nr:hypothetical protein NUW58_g244 [Xylaria curta]